MSSLKLISKAIKEPQTSYQYIQQLTPDEIDKYVRKAVLTEWFINPTQGQPRYVDIYRLRAFARSEWLTTVTSYLQSRIKVINYEIVAKDPKKRHGTSLRILNEISKTQKLFESCTPNGEGWKQGVETQFFRDLLELDAGVIAKTFTRSSYTGDPYKPKSLKPKGHRLLGEFMAIDGGSVLKDIGEHNVLKAYWQYSYTKPNTKPAFFNPDEICYVTRYPRSYSPYGWSVIQSADAILNSLINSATWNSNFFSNQGVPRGMITLADAGDEDVKRFRAYWRQKIKGHWYDMPVINKKAEWVPFAMNARDMEWLSGQKWYQRLICALYQVHPSEIAVEDTSRQAGAAATSRDRLQKRSSVVPLLLIGENALNKHIVSEISPRVIFRYAPDDPEEAEMKTEAENKMAELGLKTINEIRTERGEPKVIWGDLPPAILQNLIRSWSRLGVIPSIAEMNRFDWSNVNIPEKKASPFEPEE